MPSLTRRFGATRPALAALLLVALATPAFSGVAAASPQDQLAQKQAEARRLEAQINANGDRISVLDEQFNQTQIAIDKARDGIADTQRRLDAATAKTNDLKSRLAGRAAALYVGAANGNPAEMMDVSDVQELGSRSKYGSAAADEDHAIIDELAVSKEQLGEAKSAFEKSKTKAEQKKSKLDSTRSQLKAAQDEQEQLLASKKGEIATLVDRIEQERKAAEAARARAEFERVQQEQAQQRDAASSDESSTTSSTSGGHRSRHHSSSSGSSHPPAPNSRAQVAVDTAMAQLGKPYRYAAAGPGSFDCSGLTMYAWRAAGVSLPHSSAAQYSSLPHVSRGQLVPGDLVFYGSPIHHVGMYIGGGMYVHAPHTGDVVKVAPAFRDDYVGAARPG